MSIFRIVPDSDRFNCMEAHEKYWPILDRFTGSKLAATWKRIPLLMDTSVGRVGDFPSLRGPVPVFSQRAWNALQPLIEKSVEALPVKCGTHDYYLINVIDVVDCLDHARSHIKRFSSGRIMLVESYCFRDSCLTTQVIWKLPETASLEVLVSESFRRAVEKSQLQGLLLEKLA